MKNKIINAAGKTFLITCTLFIMIACHKGAKDPSPDSLGSITSTSFKLEFNSYDLQILDQEDMPYSQISLLQVGSLPSDSNDTLRMGMFIWEGEYYNHPVRLAQKILRCELTYRETGDSLFLRGADIYIQKLFEIGHWNDDAIYFPYEFELYPHAGRGEDNDIKLRNPWFSGMSQGQVLSALSLLYRTTGDVKYLDYAEPVFKSFTKLKSNNDPWIVYIDSADNLWIEEYPFDDPTNVLNGFIFGIFGLYDYYLCDQQNELRKFILNATITTIENNIQRYRREDSYSYYCLGHRYAAESYHHIHADQLATLSMIANSDYLFEMSESFKLDND
ncbi:MAG: hypothetical protein ISR87_04660 [Candidatus Marinimicrobia bacterium]|nr:hypothetical protein [FCB group bacterium]MBL7024728.1 hypothetical protein [Candidatus Neomarinimicrobiota bacterium]